MEFLDNIFLYGTSIIRNIIAWIGFDPAITNMLMAAVYTVTILIICTLVALFYVLYERKLAGFIQYRPGPNKLGPFGMFQTIADAIKLLTKEDIVPINADKAVHLIAPMVVFLPPILALGVIPFGKNLAAIDLNLGLLYILAITSLSTFSSFMAGWSANNKYSMLGAMRAISQKISYEIPSIFAVLAIAMMAGSLNLSSVVESQETIWFVFLQPIAFLIFFIAGLAETNRAPFDLPEGESELTAGYLTEYSGMKWALFFLAEYCSMFVISGLITTLFLGGWLGPILPGWMWFILKVHVMMTLMIWIRWTFPRMRVDKLLTFSWKVLIPVSMANIFITGIGLYIFNNYF